MDRRTFLQQAGAAAVLTRAALGQTPDLEEVTISGLARISPRQAAEGYLSRIRDIDASLRSVIEINPDALSIADELDRGPKRGPLHGVPVLIKDNIDTADRMKTTAGSFALMDTPQPRDAALVERLRVAGAVILGSLHETEYKVR